LSEENTISLTPIILAGFDFGEEMYIQVKTSIL